jgi:hypothetical protein
MPEVQETNWLALAERRFEFRILGPLGIVWLVMAVVQVAVNGNWRLGIALLAASFFAGVIGSSLHKNQTKTQTELAQGPSHDAAVPSPAISEGEHARTFARSTVRFAFLVAALIGFIAFDAGHSWFWTTGAIAVAWLAAVAIAAVASLAEIIVWNWRTESH